VDWCFIGAALDRSLHAFDIETGREVLARQPAESRKATPMSYRLAVGRTVRGDRPGRRRRLGHRRLRRRISPASRVGFPRMKKIILVLTVFSVACAPQAAADKDVSGWEKQAQGITIIRDTWGIPTSTARPTRTRCSA
jgi:hypothetical protein